MRIDDHAFVHLERISEHDVRRLSPDAPQRGERLRMVCGTAPPCLARIIRMQAARMLLALGAEESGGLD